MKNAIKHPSTILSAAALFVALSGSAYAVSSLPSNSVGNAQLKSNAVTSAKVKNGSLKAADFAPSVQLKGDKGDKGDAGPAGPQGVQGVKGTFGTITIQRADYPLNDNSSVSSAGQGNVACPSGQVGVGGGANISDVTHSDAKITGSGPRKGTIDNPIVPENGDEFTVWRASAVNPAGGDGNTTLRVYIVCASK